MPNFADKHGGAREMIRLLVADDEQMVREGLRMVLALERDMAVVGEAANGQAALDLAAAICPDVVIMDLEMPGMDGITATAALRSVAAHSAVVMLSIHNDVLSRERAFAAGAAAYVDKDARPERLLEAIRSAARTASASGAAPAPAIT
jgi:DNA-binding NarL/FixJ family response regulator